MGITRGKLWSLFTFPNGPTLCPIHDSKIFCLNKNFPAGSNQKSLGGVRAVVTSFWLRKKIRNALSFTFLRIERKNVYNILKQTHTQKALFDSQM